MWPIMFSIPGRTESLRPQAVKWKQRAVLGAGYWFQAFPDVIKCGARSERWLPFEKDNNGPKMFCLPHGHKEHKPVHKNNRNRRVLPGFMDRKGRVKSPYFPPKASSWETGSLLGITQLDTKFFNCRSHCNSAHLAKNILVCNKYKLVTAMWPFCCAPPVIPKLWAEQPWEHCR